MSDHAFGIFSDSAFQRHRHIASHVLYWLVVLAFFTLYFGRPQSDYLLSLLFVSLLLPITVATTYVVLYVLIPRYLLKKRYGLFALYFCYTLLLSLYLEVGLVVVLFMTVAEYQELVVQPGLVGQLDVIVGMYLFVFLAAALHLLKRWYSLQTANSRLAKARLEAELKLKEAELALLRSQLHPHFLFNTLNNLYGLTLARSDQAPAVVLQISDMLDYILSCRDALRVSLEEEVVQLHNYIALERLRHDERLTITFEVEGPIADWMVAPLLLMPFVENSFKHGANASGKDGWVRMALAVEGARLRFSVANSKGPKPAKGSQGVSSGVGLANVRKRLVHLYPGRHTLNITEDPDEYTVELTLEGGAPENTDHSDDVTHHQIRR